MYPCLEGFKHPGLKGKQTQSQVLNNNKKNGHLSDWSPKRENCREAKQEVEFRGQRAQT